MINFRRLVKSNVLLGLTAVVPALLWVTAPARGQTANPAPPSVTVGRPVHIPKQLESISGVSGWVVNGEIITMKEVRDRAVEFSGPYIVRDLVAATLLHQEAKQRGITVTDAEVEAKAKEMRQEQGLSDDATFERFLASQRKTKAWFYDKVRDYVLIEKLLSDKVHVSDREVEDFYNRFRQAYYRPASVSYRAMSFSTEAAAQEALAELRKGKSFQEIAKEHATTPVEKAIAGEITTYQKGQQPALPPEIEAALFSAPLAQVIGPLKTTYRGKDYYHIFKVESKRDEHQFTLNEAKEIIRAEIRRRKLEEEVYPRWLDTALSGASIEVIPANKGQKSTQEQQPQKSGG